MVKSFYYNTVLYSNNYKAKDALDYVTNRKIFWAQQETPQKIKKEVGIKKEVARTETTKAKLVAVSTFMRDIMPKNAKTKK